MKKFLTFITFLVFALLIFTSCNDEPLVNYVDFSADGYSVIYNKDNFRERAVAESFVSTVQQKTGKKLPLSNHIFAKSSECEIVFGSATSRDEYKTVAAALGEYATPDIGAWCVRVIGRKLVVLGNNDTSLKLASDYLSTLVTSEGIMVDEKLNKLVVYDYRAYINNGTVTEYTDTQLASISTAATIAVGDLNIKDFSRDVLEYSVDTDFITGYKTVVAIPSAIGATVTVTQAADNNGVALVTVKSKDSSTSTTYKVNFVMNNEYEVNAKVVNKGGASSAVVFTIDDGDRRTATFVASLLEKYPSLKATLGIVTNKIAKAKTEGTPNTESYKWAMDDQGKYIYEVDEEAYNFWKKIVDTGRLQLTSHSYTHAYVGADDNGGVFEYETSSGTMETSKYFPKGNIQMELFASRQMIMDLYPSQSVLGYIKPGTGAVNSDYYYDVLINHTDYIGARSTAGNYTTPSVMVNTAEWLATWRNRYYVKGYMVQHYTTNADILTDKDSTPEECFAAGIPAWTNYIDEAVKAQAMACFCIHTIKPDDYVSSSGHYIYDSQAEQLFAYADKLSKSGDAWVAFFDEALIYYNEWSTSKVTATAFKDEKITLTMTHEEKGECYNMPLTVKVSVPNTWESATINGTEVEVKSDDDGKFVFADVLMGTPTVIEKN